MTRPTLHPVDNQIYTGLLLLASSNDGLTQTELHNELNRITNENLSIISTLQKIKKLEIYDLIEKEEKEREHNAKKLYFNFEEIIRIISIYLISNQNEINDEIKHEFNYWKFMEKTYKKFPNSYQDDFHHILFENIMKEISNSHDYTTKYSYTQTHFINILSNYWFINLMRYILRFHSINPKYYKGTFSQLLYSIIEYFIMHYESIEEYITNYTTEKLINLQNQYFDFEWEKEIHDYIEGKNNTLELFKHIRNLRLIQPMYSHTSTALWILESQTRI